MSTIELLSRLHWGEWVVYGIVFLVIVWVLYHKEISYSIRITDQYGTSFFSTLLYSILIPTKYLECNNYDLEQVKKLEYALHGLNNELCHAEYISEENKIYIHENDNIVCYSIGDTGMKISYITIAIPPKVLLMALCTYNVEKNKPRLSKKSMLT